MGSDETWVKLYRKSLANETRRRDPTAWRLFETLLLLVNADTGTWSGGRYQLTEADGYLNGSTIYKALKRLEKSGMISVNSNTRYTEIHICNFNHYAKRGNTSSNNKVTTDGQPSNTLTRIKNKEIRNIYTSSSDELRQLHEEICKAFGKSPERYKLLPDRKRKLLARLKDTGKENIINACKALSQSAFHMGENDRGWIADPYWALSSAEKAETWSQKHTQTVKDLSNFKIEEDI